MDIFSLKYKEKQRNTNRDSRIAAGLRFLSELSKFETSFNSPTNLRKKGKVPAVREAQWELLRILRPKPLHFLS